MTNSTPESFGDAPSFTEGHHRIRRSREWIGRAVFEAGLIVLGLVGALLIDEWRDARQRNERVQNALASVTAELQGNRDALDMGITYNEPLITKLLESEKTGVIYEGAILRRTPLSSVAWDAVRDAGITSDVPHAQLMSLGSAYSAQASYISELGVFSSYLYTYQGPRSFREMPGALAGWLNDLTGRARSVRQRVDEALKVLPAPAAVESH